MFIVLESLRSALRSLAAYPLRSFLTTLGVNIGVASVVTVVAIMHGLSASIGGELQGLGADTLTVEGYTPFEEQLQGRHNVLDLRDYRRIVTRVDGIHGVAAAFSPFAQGATVHAGGRTAFGEVNAVTATYQDAMRLYPDRGRMLLATDGQSRRKVCFIGAGTLRKLGLSADALGRFVEIGADWYKIVGIAEAKGKMFGVSRDDYVLIPFEVGEAIVDTAAKPDLSISFKVEDLEHLDAVRSRVTALLRQAHRLKPGQPDDFRIQTARQLSDSLQGILGMVTAVLAAITAISLVVGGVGIMNIMLVSATERTREIGICKALGARNRDVLLQFLIEAATLSLAGGLTGLGFGCLLGHAASALIPGFPAASFPWWGALVAIGFSVTVGVVFGLAPAIKASRLDPIDALRHE